MTPGPTMRKADQYAPLQVVLHWTVLALILVQLLSNDWIETAFDARMEGIAQPTPLMAYLHIAAGVTILILMVTRLLLRLTIGVPPARTENALLFWMATLTHWALYAVVLAMPVVGATAWFGYNEFAGEMHELAALVLVPLILVHAAGGLFEHFIMRNDTLLRMLRLNVQRRPPTAPDTH